MKTEDPDVPSSAKSLWLAVGALVVLMVVAWTILFVLAFRNPVESVPVEYPANP